MKSYQVTAAPAIEPITPAQLRMHLHTDDAAYDDEDARVSDLITTARQWLERKTGQMLVSQTVQMTTTLYDEIVHAPVSGLIGEGTRLVAEITPGPVISVATVEFETKSLTWQTLTENTDYLLDNLGNESGAYIYLADYVLSFWTGTFTGIGVYPVERRGPRLRVTYTAGYGTVGASAPYTLREAIKQAAAYLYDNPGAPIPDSLVPSDYIPWRV